MIDTGAMRTGIQLTAKGRKQLSTQHARWMQFVDAVSALMKPRSV